jgi:hypothetical protein
LSLADALRSDDDIRLVIMTPSPVADALLRKSRRSTDCAVGSVSVEREAVILMRAERAEDLMA